MPQHNAISYAKEHMSKGINLGTLLVVLFVGVGIGYWLTPEYQVQNAQMKKGHDLGVADQWVDLRYIDGMIAHHLSAIYLLEQAQQQSDRQEIRDLASVVIEADKQGIEKLYAQKQAWYGNDRQVTEFTKINLGTKDETFDLRLLNALLIHHQEAIDTAQEISTKSTRNEVLDLASQVRQALTANSEQLKTWRKAWYAVE
jgi:uncharacterized protein (DUF305 family)